MRVLALLWRLSSAERHTRLSATAGYTLRSSMRARTHELHVHVYRCAATRGRASSTRACPTCTRPPCPSPTCPHPKCQTGPTCNTPQVVFVDGVMAAGSNTFVLFYGAADTSVGLEPSAIRAASARSRRPSTSSTTTSTRSSTRRTPSRTRSARARTTP